MSNYIFYLPQKYVAFAGACIYVLNTLSSVGSLPLAKNALLVIYETLLSACAYALARALIFHEGLGTRLPLSLLTYVHFEVVKDTTVKWNTTGLEEGLLQCLGSWPGCWVTAHVVISMAVRPH